MKNVNKVEVMEQEEVLQELEASQLAEVAGGAFILKGDDYCGTPFPGRPLLLLTQEALAAQIRVSP
jgi:hypothetical protein